MRSTSTSSPSTVSTTRSLAPANPPASRSTPRPNAPWDGGYPWVTAYASNVVGRFAPGTNTGWDWFYIPTPDSGPRGIAFKDNGSSWDIWFTQENTNRVGRSDSAAQLRPGRVRRHGPARGQQPARHRWRRRRHGLVRGIWPSHRFRNPTAVRGVYAASARYSFHDKTARKAHCYRGNLLNVQLVPTILRRIRCPHHCAARPGR